MSNADSRILEKIEDSVIREKYVCDGKLNCQIRCPMCPSKILPIKSAKLVEFSKKLPGKISRIIIGDFIPGKVGCVFVMVIWSEFRMEQYRDDDHREYATHFNFLCLNIFNMPSTH